MTKKKAPDGNCPKCGSPVKVEKATHWTNNEVVACQNMVCRWYTKNQYLTEKKVSP